MRTGVPEPPGLGANLGDATWAGEVTPVVDALRALPDPDRGRDRVSEHVMVVFDEAL